jgi:hypothetical protein
MTIVIVLAIVVAVILIGALVVAKLPDEFCVTRSITMAAPPSAPFARVNDFYQWTTWSPWEGIDPTMQRFYEGPKAGVDARYGWTGKKVGAGKMRIAQSDAPNLVRIELIFERPMKATNLCEFTFTPQGTETLVSWSMTGKNPPVGKILSFTGLQEKICGTMFDQGLKKMKVVCESA